MYLEAFKEFIKLGFDASNIVNFNAYLRDLIDKYLQSGKKGVTVTQIH